MIRITKLYPVTSIGKPRASGDDPEKMVSDLKGKK